MSFRAAAVLLLLLLRFAVFCTCGDAFYLSATHLEINIEGAKYQKEADPTILLARAFVQTTSEKDPITYSLEDSNQHILYVNSTSGEVKFKNGFFLTSDGTREINAVICASDKANDTAKLALKIVVTTVPFIDCRSIVEDLCFWTKVQYQVRENKGVTRLGPTASQYFENKCKEYKLTYSIVDNGEDRVKVEQQVFSLRGFLMTTGPLDKDGLWKSESNVESGSQFTVAVQCVVQGPNSFRKTVQRNVSVIVLDEDDNPLVPQPPSVMDIYLPTGNVKKGDLLPVNEELFFMDMDSMEMNQYDVKLRNDDAHLLRPECNMYSYSHKRFNTVLRCHLYFVKSTTIRTSPYTIHLDITDTKLTQGNRTVTITMHIYTGVNAASSVVTEQVLTPTKGLLYPSLQVKILRTAAPYARVTQPLQDPAAALKDRRYRITHDTSRSPKFAATAAAAAFNVTARGGIVFVQNTAVLRQAASSVVLTLEGRDRNGKVMVDSITVNVVEELNVSCKNEHDWSTCAKFDTAQKCHDGCGISTGGAIALVQSHNLIKTAHRCVWRGSRSKTRNSPTTKYQTCTPDINTCPDHVCDELERLNHRICPQDCTTNVQFGEHNDKTGVGIYQGSGICTCFNSGNCNCVGPVSSLKKTAKAANVARVDGASSVASSALPDIQSQFSKSEEPPTLHSMPKMQTNVHKAQSVSTCGPVCLLGVVLGALVIVVVVGGWLICRIRTWRELGLRDHKYISSVTALPGVQSEYVHQTSLTPLPAPNPLQVNFSMNLSLAKKHTPDPKWEFPRKNLQVEQTLGEGEFGRVLKAQAVDIAGIPGPTTVAVKTLKEHARGSELDDLISEYELLKEVSHPNVIRLLGASTSSGGPVYLIIEYAEFGSLRNYLRKSRNLESECFEKGESFYEPDPALPAVVNSTVTPKDILSYAWQISKGMAYLGDKKLVHRDLAARNVLLASGKVCKISDFGLTRDVYEDNAYLKKSKGRVPIKWMAPESLADHVYTNRSDVWSFGILLWELVTLGGSPYPGVAVENLFTLLRSGYRMEKPPNCSTQLYVIMQKCWELDPVERPSFRTLTERLEIMLADGVEYLNLNLRAVQNRAYFTTLTDTPETTAESEELNMPKYGNDSVPKPDLSINLREMDGQMKCADAKKFPQWAVTSFDSQYQNDETQMLGLNHYEAPIRYRNSDLLVESQDKALSYIDMTSNRNGGVLEEKPLLKTRSYEHIIVNKITNF